MLTPRGWWFLLAILCLVVFAGLVPPSGMGTLSLVGMTLVGWFLWEWLFFAFRTAWVVRSLHLERELRDEQGLIDMLWSGRAFEVRVRLRLPSWLELPYVLAADRIPFGVDLAGGRNEGEGVLTIDQPLEIAYRLHCPAPGKLRFEGLALHVTDLQGFFHFTTFLPCVTTIRVLPPLADGESSATLKRHNLLLPPGVHRHRRPGSGSELLDLRDYLPGDPPKLIAWKASARRDRLITKEFESEVPVRCTLFVDTSISVRVGPPRHNALTRLVEIAGAVAQAAISNRDLVGLALFDDQQVQYVRPARGSRHLARLLDLLTDVAGLAPSTGKADLRRLLALAYAFAQEVYPDLMRPERNRVPFWLPWLWPLPPSSPTRNRLGSLLRLSALWTILVFVLFATVLRYDFILMVLLLAVPFLAWPLVNLVHRLLPQWQSNRRRREVRWRKRLAALLSVQYGLAPGGLAWLMEDNEAMAEYLQQFLAEHQVPYPLPLYDDEGRYALAAPGKVARLADTLLRAVGKGHDNELFVLLADLIELEDELAPLLRAVTVARARHHRVVIVCPWPPDIAVPSATPGPESTATPATWESGPGASLEESLHQTTTRRFHRAFYQLRRTFARMGVPLICAARGETARWILDRLEGLRILGRTR